jgi:hypothetical protein
VSFILVATFPNMMPGGYRFLIIGPIIDGALGGVSTLIASINAYISDVTPDGSRAKVFSRLTGIMMLGFAAGPAIGSFVIDRSGNMWVTVSMWTLQADLQQFAAFLCHKCNPPALHFWNLRLSARVALAGRPFRVIEKHRDRPSNGTTQRTDQRDRLSHRSRLAGELVWCLDNLFAEDSRRTSWQRLEPSLPGRGSVFNEHDDGRPSVLLDGGADSCRGFCKSKGSTSFTPMDGPLANSALI